MEIDVQELLEAIGSLEIPDELRIRLNRVRQQRGLAALWPGMTFTDAIMLTELEIARGGQDGNLN
jgi:hypothetical protein